MECTCSEEPLSGCPVHGGATVVKFCRCCGEQPRNCTGLMSVNLLDRKWAESFDDDNGRSE